MIASVLKQGKNEKKGNIEEKLLNSFNRFPALGRDDVYFLQSDLQYRDIFVSLIVCSHFVT